MEILSLTHKKGFQFYRLWNNLKEYSSFFGLLMIFLLIFSCTPEKSAPTSPDQDQTISPEEKTWLQNNAITLDTTEYTGNYSDLIPLNEMIGDARIVALSISSYGTHEFFTVSQRILDFLVQEKNFNIFALQANFNECEYINDYVLTGKGILSDLQGGLIQWTWDMEETPNRVLLWMWDTEEMTNMINWMQIQNVGHQNEPVIYFAGFDIISPYAAIGNVISYLNMVDSANARLAASTYTYFNRHFFHYPLISNSLREFCRQYVVAMYDTLKNNQERYITLSSQEDYDFALQNAYFALQAEEVFRSKDPAFKFSYMVDNIEYLMNRYGVDSKVVLFAHSDYLGNSGGSLGSQLKSKYGDQFKIIGFSFYNGEFSAASINPEINWKGNPCIHEAELPPQDSYEAYLRESERSALMLNLRYPGNPTGSGWLDETKMMRFIGHTYDVTIPGQLFYPESLRDFYDIIFHVQSVNATKLLTILP
jgi:erythromycin esterase